MLKVWARVSGDQWDLSLARSLLGGVKAPILVQCDDRTKGGWRL